MTIMKPTRKEVIEHYKECDHCRHWFKFLKKELLKKQEVKMSKKENKSIKKMSKIEIEETIKDYQMFIRKLKRELKRRGKE